jgi:hypothetical protein
VEQALRTELSFQRKLLRRMLVAAAIIGPVALAPEMSSAEGLLDFFFGGQKQQHQTSFFGNVFNNSHRRRGRLSQARDLASACAAATENIFR